MSYRQHKNEFSGRPSVVWAVCGAILTALAFSSPQAFTQEIITTVAGNGIRGFAGDGGPAKYAALSFEGGIAVDSKGNLYIAETGNHRIRKVSPVGMITTVAGNGIRGFSGDGRGATSAALNSPSGLAVDSEDNLFVVDRGNQRIRRISADGIITTIAGNGIAGYGGDGGAATQAMFNFGSSAGNCAIDKAGNLYIPDTGNNRIRKLDPAGIITTLTESPSPYSVAVNAAGEVYFGNSLGVVTRIKTQGGAEVVAGGGSGWAPDAYPALDALLTAPTGVALDATGNLYIVDSRLQSLRKVSPYGTMTPLAGSMGNEIVNGAFSGDGGPAEKSELNSPSGIAVGRDYSIYIADSRNNRIRKIVTSSVSTDKWTPANSQLPDDLVTALVVDPSDPDTLFAGTASHGVFKSTNAGADWSQTGLVDSEMPGAGSEINVLVVDPSHAGTLYAGTYNMGLMRSTDGGVTWSSVWSATPDVRLLTLDPHNSSTLLLAGYGNLERSDVLYKSTDAGKSWTPIPLPSRWIQSVSVSPVNPDIIYLLDSGGDPQDDTSQCRLWKSSDRGQNWTTLSSFPECLWHLVADPTEPNTFFAYGENAYKSGNGGKAWISYSIPVDTIAVDPANSSTVYSISHGNVYRSTDKGESWSSLTDGLADAPQALAVSGSNPATVFAGTYAGGVFKDAAMFTLNQRDYCIGEKWQASIVGQEPGAPILLGGVSNGVPWEWPGWGIADSDGNYIASGTFGEGSEGIYSLYVQVGEVKSNAVVLTISGCTQGTFQPHLEIVPPTGSDAFCIEENYWSLRLTNAPPNARVYLVGDAAGVPPGFTIPDGSQTDSQGSFSASGPVTLPAGQYNLSVVVGGLRSNTVPVEIVGDCN